MDRARRKTCPSDRGRHFLHSVQQMLLDLLAQVIPFPGRQHPNKVLHPDCPPGACLAFQLPGGKDWGCLAFATQGDGLQPAAVWKDSLFSMLSRDQNTGLHDSHKDEQVLPMFSGHAPTPDVTEDTGWVLGLFCLVGLRFVVITRLVLFWGGVFCLFWFSGFFFVLLLFSLVWLFFLPDEGDMIWSYKDEKTNTNKLCWCQLNVAMSPGNSFLKLLSPHFPIRCTGTNIKSFNGIKTNHIQSIKWTD